MFFLPVFIIFYIVAPNVRIKNITTLAFSIFFFAWGEPVFIGYVLVGTAIDYLAIKVGCAPERPTSQRRRALVLAVTINVAALLYFKYANFFMAETTPLLAQAGWSLGEWRKIALPLGISFITFHKISFVVDLYKGRAPPPRNFLDALLYIFLFPQLIAGPIVRYHDIGDQIIDRSSSADDVLAGFQRFAMGLVKKVLIADQVAVMVQSVAQTPSADLPWEYAWLGALAYTVQIYFDFSGYSDMAIGMARMMGFRFPENFNRPYTATSVTDFWRRWHMTLSRWMHEYLYVPLGGNRASLARTFANLWIVFLLSGFWHGAAWTFVAWGAFHGFFLSLEKAAAHFPWKPSIPAQARQAATFLIVLNGWVLFRADSLSQAMSLWARMYGLGPAPATPQQPFWLMFEPQGLVCLVVGLVLGLAPSRRHPALPPALLAHPAVRLTTGGLLLTAGLAGAFSGNYSPFLYFRF
ncbi:MBOAT family O-acyltransferase [Paramagnetospirillum magneticum]|nr:MBOAT family protein [Paramagnetospirillum magneticum]